MFLAVAKIIESDYFYLYPLKYFKAIMLGKTSAIGFVLISLSVISCRSDKAKTINSLTIFSSYRTSHKATLFNVPPGMVSLFLDDSKKGNKELKDLLNDVTDLSFLIIKKESNIKIEDLVYQELNAKLDSIHFFDVAQINTGKEIIRVKVDKERRHFNEIVVLVSKYDALYCISFKGKIPSRKVINLVKPENVVAVTNLDRFKQ